jgi:molybdenum cofactor cytidylyltransferase
MAANEKKNQIAALVLAAGSSSRLGQPKQLVEVGGETLLERTVGVVWQAGCREIAVVLGAHREKIAPLAEQLPVGLVYNERWAEGMGSSIACGIDFLQQHFPETEAVLIVLTDQPLLSEDFLLRLIKAYQTSAFKIAAADYGDAPGPPSIFGRDFFVELSNLNGQQGARKILQKHREQLASLPFPEGHFDLDTPEDLERLRQLS